MKPKTIESLSSDRGSTDQIAAFERSSAGLVSGARILTLRAMQPVEKLRVGDSVITRARGAVRVTEIKTVSLVTRAVYIIAGSIGHYRKDRDALVAADQTVLLRDWRARALFGQKSALVRASALIDGEFVRDLGQQAITLHRIYCGTPQIIFADGLELGTADARACHPLRQMA